MRLRHALRQRWGRRSPNPEPSSTGAAEALPPASLALPTTRSFPLTMATPGETVRVVCCRGGDGMARRLTDLGLRLNSAITPLNHTPGGAVVVRCQDSRVGIGAGMAHRVMVAPIEESKHG